MSETQGGTDTLTQGTEADLPVAERGAAEILADIKQLVDPQLERRLDALHPTMRGIGRYHFGWQDASGAPDPTGSGGKALRPALAVLGARAVGAAGDEPEVLDAACAVELIHNFSLLHDDIMDGDRTRRHRPTAWTVYGVDQTLLAGCALQTLAFQVLTERSPHAVASLAASVQVLIAGQSEDLDLAGNDAATVDQCLEMESGKTASLLAASASLGAHAYGADPERVRLLSEYGHHLGMAFQLVDDLLGIWGETGTTGKPVAADLYARKRSAPVVAALTAGSPASERLRRVLSSEGDLSDADLVLAADLVEQAGGRSWTQDRADLHTREALARLDRLAPHPRALADLGEVTRFLLSRTW
ncbi:polyprenyl synthetase family protein [Actinospica robiniae]|uniref:polyprenyl synthetase family protein n=1 Tax=Actinospica robiniae TaxID=304901 RepID=UPI0003F978B5|nr:polyprenyl synthetase family protein [Actinospica robiniae]